MVLRLSEPFAAVLPAPAETSDVGLPFPVAKLGRLQDRVPRGPFGCDPEPDDGCGWLGARAGSEWGVGLTCEAGSTPELTRNRTPEIARNRARPVCTRYPSKTGVTRNSPKHTK